MDCLDVFARDAAACTSVRDLYAVLASTLDRAGFPFWAFGALWGDGNAFEDHAEPAVALNYPDDWIRAYFKAQYERVDPVVLVMPYATGAVQWRDLRHYCPEMFDAAAEYGLKSGVSIPLRTLSGCYVFCAVRSDPADLDAETLLMLEMIAAGFFAAYLRLRCVSPESHSLTANTVEVLRLTMAGRTRKEIAAQLGLTVDGVHWCLKDAKAKLQCRTTEAALLRAVSLGILRI